MSWVILQSAATPETGVVGTTFSATYPSNVSSGTKLICYVSVYSPATSITATVKDAANNAMTQVGWLWNATGQTAFGVFAMDTPAGDIGAKPVITVTLSASVHASVLIQEVSGLAVGNTLAAMADGTAASAEYAAGASNAQPAYSSTAAGEFLVSFAGDSGGPQTMTAPAGYTADAHAVNNNAWTDAVPASKNSTGGAESGTWTYTGSTTSSGLMVVAFKLAAAVGGIPGNKLAYNSESLETSIASWSVLANCTIAQSALHALDGTKSLAITSVAAGVASTINATGTQGYPAATPTVSCQFFYAVYTATAGLNATATFDWYNGATWLSAATGSVTSLTQNGWTWVTVTATAPATATLARIYPGFTATAAGQIAYLDEIYFGPPASFPVFGAALPDLVMAPRISS